MRQGAIRIVDWTLQPGSQRLSNGPVVRRLNPKEFGVLVHLAEAAPDLVGSDALLARTWPSAVVSDGALYQVISRLRRCFCQDGDDAAYIETQSKRGYRLVAPVRILRPRPAPRRTDEAHTGAVSPADTLPLRCAANRVRVQLQLVDAWASGFSVWADRFTRPMADLFALQDDIARQVVEALILRFGSGQAPAQSAEDARRTRPG